MNNPDNFSQLKSLFDAEVERLASPEIKNDNHAVAPIIASLLDGFTIEQAKSFLFQASEIFTCVNTVNASEIYKRMGWGSLSR